MKTPEAIAQMADEPNVEQLKNWRAALIAEKSDLESAIAKLGNKINTLEEGKRIERERGSE